jgi:hypothetical protein
MQIKQLRTAFHLTSLPYRLYLDVARGSRACTAPNNTAPDVFRRQPRCQDRGVRLLRRAGLTERDGEENVCTISQGLHVLGMVAMIGQIAYSAFVSIVDCRACSIL